MNEKHLMHVKFTYDEALINKKKILSLELDTLRMLLIIKKYHELRLLELNNKIEINKRIKRANTNLSNLKKTFPKVEVPKKYKQAEIKEIEKKEKSKPRYPTVLERQLQEIQNKLKEIDQKF